MTVVVEVVVEVAMGVCAKARAGRRSGSVMSVGIERRRIAAVEDARLLGWRLERRSRVGRGA